MYLHVKPSKDLVPLFVVEAKFILILADDCLTEHLQDFDKVLLEFASYLPSFHNLISNKVENMIVKNCAENVEEGVGYKTAKLSFNDENLMQGFISSTNVKNSDHGYWWEEER